MHDIGDSDEPWRRDEALVCVSGVEWIAKNVFLVSVPSYGRKVSCELTAVDVPRGTSAELTSVVAAVLRKVNSAMRVYLRQDFYSNFPLEGYGDVLFSEESRCDRTMELHWCSLQETLVRAGVACVVRPSVVRFASLLEAESQADADSLGVTWLSQLHTRERSALFREVHRCVVEDVMRGDIYRVSWLTGRKCADAVHLPPLLVLDATVCESPSTAKGFAAMRWAQRGLLHRELLVHVHAVFPSDKDVAFNTQLETYEHLANVRGTAWLLCGGNQEERKGADVGEVLVTLELAWIRRVADAGVPRASNWLQLCRSVGVAATEALSSGFTSNRSTEHTAEAYTADDGAALAVALHLPPSAVAGLLSFSGEWWGDAFRRGKVRRRMTPVKRDFATAVGATRKLWATVLWCGNVHRDPNDEPHVYLHRPLRTLFPLAGLALGRVRLEGYVEGAAILRCYDGARVFLQVEVTTVSTAADWKKRCRNAGYAGTSVVHFYPSSRETFFSNSVNVFISAAGTSEDEETRLRVSCSHYREKTFLLSQHAPSKDWVVTKTAEYVASLSLNGTNESATVFVLDVVVEGRDENALTWTQRGVDRAIYLLSPDPNGEASNTMDEEEADDDTRKNAAETDTKFSSASIGKSVCAASGTRHFLSKLSLFFEVDARQQDATNSAGEPLLARVQRAFYDLLYENVVILPVGVAEVNGVRGLVGDLLFPSDPVPRATPQPLEARAEPLFRRSLLSCIGRGWWCSDEGASAASAMIPWPMSGAVYEAVQASFLVALEAVVQEEWAARKRHQEEVQWELELFEQQVRSCFSSHCPQQISLLDEGPASLSEPQLCLCLTAGEAKLWYDSLKTCPRLSLSKELLPPTLPLSLFAVRPRELFYTAASQKKRVVGRGGDASPQRPLQEEAYDQLDWAFMRFRLPNLPNIMHTDWERFPLSLRNTERALCDSIARKALSTPAVPGMLYATERTFSLMLSYLAHLQCASHPDANKDAAVPDAGVGLATVYAMLQHYTASFLEDCQSPMRFSATLFVLPSFKADGDAHRVLESRPLFLGSRDNSVTDFFEVPLANNASPEIVPFPLHRDITRACVSALGVEALVQSCDEAGGRETCASVDCGLKPEELRTLGGCGLAWGAAKESTTPVLYHPLPRLAVLGSPLVGRDELTAEALGSLGLERNIFAGVTAAAGADTTMMTRRVVGLRYRCLPQFSDKNPYQSISYGRVSSRGMYSILLKDRARGAELQTYMSLLLRKGGASALRQSSDGDSSAFPDGELTVYGLPSEPLYVHYRSRADLRFTLSTVCAPLRNELLQVEEAHGGCGGSPAVMDEVETRLLSFYAEAADGLLQRIYQRVREEQGPGEEVEQVTLIFTLQPRGATTEPYVAIQLFPVYPSDAEVTERVLNHASVWRRHPVSHGNPHRAFSLYGSRYGRLALAELRVAYDAEANAFRARWNDAYERGPASPS
ncbi:hypothetical protein LSCM1_02493 [Leishmania martiniquensis]|uniref:Uncharacterized protein n=1 Tax=Leishmania martiniquensis TaxID=1580590 RepID=A0A836GSS5_9TRYP|nr:hypothetical protein LSCM1_02493 [Leishmania martiniquensis]